jgi:hypothetical protein
MKESIRYSSQAESVFVIAESLARGLSRDVRDTPELLAGLVYEGTLRVVFDQLQVNRDVFGKTLVYLRQNEHHVSAEKGLIPWSVPAQKILTASEMDVFAREEQTVTPSHIFRQFVQNEDTEGMQILQALTRKEPETIFRVFQEFSL